MLYRPTGLRIQDVAVALVAVDHMGSSITAGRDSAPLDFQDRSRQTFMIRLFHHGQIRQIHTCVLIGEGVPTVGAVLVTLLERRVAPYLK